MTDVQTEASVSSETEKGSSPVLAFLNDDVASLTWQDLSVKVSDRVTRQEKYILQASSGMVRAGMEVNLYPFSMPLLTHLQEKSLLSWARLDPARPRCSTHSPNARPRPSKVR
jgi:hypothetical protein